MKSKSKIFIVLGILCVIIVTVFLLFRDNRNLPKKADMAAVLVAELFNGNDTYKELLDKENAKYIADSFTYELTNIIEEQLSKDGIINLSELKESRNSNNSDDGVESPPMSDDPSLEEQTIDLSVIYGDSYKKTVDESNYDPITNEAGELVALDTVTENYESEEIEELVVNLPDNTTDGVFKANDEYYIYREDIIWDINGSAVIFFGDTNVILYKSELEPTYDEIVESLSYTFVDYTMIEKDDFRYYTFESADKTNILSITIQLGKTQLQHITLKIDKVK